MSAACTQAVILAAGRGSRLGPAGERLPKCLLVLAGRPLLAWSLDALRDCGIDRSLLVAGWQADRLRGWTDALVVNRRWAETGAVRSLMQADAWLRRAPTLVLYGDGVYGRSALARVIQAADADVLVPGDRQWLSLWSRRFDEPLQDAETWRSREGALQEIGGRSASVEEIEAQFMGLLRLTPGGWSVLRSRLAEWERREGGEAIDRLDMTAMLRRLLAEDRAVSCIEIDGGWVEIDSLADRDVVERSLGSAGFSHDFR